MDQKALLSERSEFRSFPIFCDAQIVLERSVSTRRPSLRSPFFDSFLRRSKERNSAAGPRPGLCPRRAIHFKRYGMQQTPLGSSLRWSDENRIAVYRMNPIPHPTSPLKGEEPYLQTAGLIYKGHYLFTGDSTSSNSAITSFNCASVNTPLCPNRGILEQAL